MNVFNSLGSNYSLPGALRALVSAGGERAREKLRAYLEKRYGGRAILCYKGREALSLALGSLPEKGTALVCGYTCLAVYEAVSESGNTIRYLDIEPSALHFSAESLRHAAEETPDLRAVVIQNTLGSPADIEGIAQVCREKRLVLIEDLAHSIGARYTDGAEAGTLGDFTVLSFSQDKVVDAVSGGALVVRHPERFAPIKDPSLSVPIATQLKDRVYPLLTWKIRLAYRLGIGRPFHALVRFLRLLSRPLDGGAAARRLPGWYCENILRAFDALEETTRHRRAIAEVYARHLDADVQISFDAARGAALRFPILIEHRGSFLSRLRKEGIHLSDIWYDAPVAPKKYAHRTGYRPGTCPVAEAASEKMLNLPTHRNISARDARAIARIVNTWLEEEGANPYEVREVAERSEWERFLAQARPHSFLQSWQWGEQNARKDALPVRLGAYREGKLAAAALFLYVPARRGAFLLCPHGPVVAQGEARQRAVRTLLAEAERIARGKGCAFVRVCPLDIDTEESRALYRTLGMQGAPIHMHPELSWMLDIAKSEDELLRGMRKTTRYLVKRMEKIGVEIGMSEDPADIEKFWPVYEATVSRQHFTPFRKEDLRREFDLFAKDGNAAFFFGSYEGEIIAAAIIIFWGGQAFYHHSGSIQKSKDVNASYLLQWRVIQEAKKRGCALYNFWGISPENRRKHPWAGLSLFKKGFGGFSESYVHAQDLPLTWRYWVNYMVESARRMRRGL